MTRSSVGSPCADTAIWGEKEPAPSPTRTVSRSSVEEPCAPDSRTRISFVRLLEQLRSRGQSRENPPMAASVGWEKPPRGEYDAGWKIPVPPPSRTVRLPAGGLTATTLLTLSGQKSQIRSPTVARSSPPPQRPTGP